MKKFLGLRGRALNLAVGIIAGCDFLLFGYGKTFFSETPSCLVTNMARQTRVSWAVSSLSVSSSTLSH